ncbi:MAG: signal peptidase II [Chloroflexi bacterium]|nr:signal peptidase II [Chloroflexota bacterium]
MTTRGPVASETETASALSVSPAPQQHSVERVDGGQATARVPWATPLVRWGILAVVASVIVTFDQVTKFLVVSSMSLGETIPVMPWVALHYITNRGVAFGMFRQFGDVLLPLSLAICSVIVYVYRTVETRRLWVRIALALQVGGAIGNVIDRVRLGAVVDFIEFHIDELQFHFAIFNVADSAICVGVVMLVAALLIQNEG